MSTIAPFTIFKYDTLLRKDFNTYFMGRKGAPKNLVTTTTKTIKTNKKIKSPTLIYIFPPSYKMTLSTIENLNENKSTPLKNK